MAYLLLLENMEKKLKVSQNMITVTIPFYNPNKTADFTKNTIDNENKKLTKSCIKVLEIIKSNPELTQEEIATITKLSLSTIKRSLKTLTDKGIIKRTGTYKKGFWQIIK